MNEIVLTLERMKRTADSVEGRLLCNGSYVCDTLEPKWCDYEHGEKKVLGHSAIPRGLYPYRISKSPKRGYDVVWLDDVPNFQGVQIHIGNYVSDTQGCILVGFKSKSPKLRLENSKICFDYLITLLRTIGASNGRILILDSFLTNL